MQTSSTPHRQEADDGYDQLEKLVARRLAETPGPWFTTDAEPAVLWGLYLSGIPAKARQHYDCHACRRFVQSFGGLVTISEHGVTVPLVWGSWCELPMPTFFVESMVGAARLVDEAKVTGVFLSEHATLGTSSTRADKKGGGIVVWTHLHGPNPSQYRASPAKNASQAMAEKHEDYGVLCRGLAEFSRVTIGQALRVLEADALCRSEKATGIAKWLLDLHMTLDDVRDRARRNNLIWRAVALAPVGFCHVRNTVLGTLLEDIAAGMDFGAIQKRWAAKLHPLAYQRPQAPPREGQLDAAEKLVANLGIERSLLRRYATLDDVLAKLWVPKAVEDAGASTTGVFARLRKPALPAIELPEKTLTLEKFLANVLPGASAVEILAPHAGPYYGLVTAADLTAPPIIQWDGLVERDTDPHGMATPLPRNPVTRYFYARGSTARDWGLAPDTWTRVAAVFLSPHQWQEANLFRHIGDACHFALEGARDQNARPGLGLFPEVLKTELREARHTIEAHSNSAGKPSGADLGNANGLAVQKSHAACNLQLRVTTPGGTARYRIDRWE